MNRVRRLAVLLGGLFLLGLVLAVPAAAHATVTSSTPADGADLPVRPAQVSITFDEPVGLQPGYLQVVDESGDRIDTGAARHPDGDGATVVVDLRAQTPPSAAGYLISYRVVSADGHPVSGTVGFSVRGGAAVTARAVQGTSPLLGAAIDLATAVSYLGLAAAGGAWLVVSRRAGVLDSRRARVIVRGGLLVAIGATVVQIAVHGPYVAGDGTTDGAGRLLVDTLASPFGVARVVQLGALLVVLLLSVPVARAAGPLQGARMLPLVAAGAAWVTALAAMVASGHARVRTPWLNLPSTTLHVLATTTWVGGLILLLALVIPAGERTGTAALVGRFSRVALVSVVVLAVTGTVQAWQQTGSWAALATTTYGVLLLVKIGLLAVLVGLGALARRHVRAGDPVRALRRGVLVEVAVVVVVLGVTSVLVAQPPASVARAADLATRPATATIRLDATRSAVLRVDPAHRGPVTVTLTLVGVAPGAEPALTATLAAERIGPLPVPLTARGGAFTAGGVDLPAPGDWTFELTVRTGRFDAVVATTTIDVG